MAPFGASSQRAKKPLTPTQQQKQSVNEFFQASHKSFLGLTPSSGDYNRHPNPCQEPRYSPFFMIKLASLRAISSVVRALT